MTPKKIVAYLDRYVIGHARPKRDLALCAWRQWFGASLETRARLSRSRTAEGPQAVLLIGPTGSGKSYLLRKLAGFFGSDLLFFSAPSLVQTGYVGMSIDRMLSETHSRCQFDRERTERSIVVIDEVDKVRNSGLTDGPDVSGAGVQQGLLTVLDGRPATVEHPRGREVINTAGMLFVFAGAFAGLDALAATRVKGTRAVGFGQGMKQLSVESPKPRTADLIEFGMLPEFVGRFTTVSFLDELSTDDLTNILRKGKESVVQRKREFFSALGVELKFEKQALSACAEEAQRLGIGARGLVRIVNHLLAREEFDLPGLVDKGISELIVTEATVRQSARARQIKRPPGPIRRKTRAGSKQPVLPLHLDTEESDSPI